MTPDDPSVTFYEGPAGVREAVKSLAGILASEGIPVSGALVMQEQNKPKGFQCVSCAWIRQIVPLRFLSSGSNGLMLPKAT